MVERTTAPARVPASTGRAKRRNDDISERDEFHLPQIVSAASLTLPAIQIIYSLMTILSPKKKYKGLL